MSEKKAKEERKNEAGPNPKDLIADMTVKMYRNGQVFVEGIPREFEVAITAITTACKAVAGVLVEEAKKDDGKIIVPHSRRR